MINSVGWFVYIGLLTFVNQDDNVKALQVSSLHDVDENGLAKLWVLSPL